MIFTARLQLGESILPLFSSINGNSSWPVSVVTTHPCNNLWCHIELVSVCFIITKLSKNFTMQFQCCWKFPTNSKWHKHNKWYEKLDWNPGPMQLLAAHLDTTEVTLSLPPVSLAQLVAWLVSWLGGTGFKTGYPATFPICLCQCMVRLGSSWEFAGLNLFLKT